MYWKEGKKLFVNLNLDNVELTDNTQEVNFPAQGFIVKVERDTEIKKYIFDEESKNLKKQFLPYYILEPFIFYREDIYFPCPIHCDKVIIEKIIYKYYKEINLEFNCILNLEKTAIYKHFLFKNSENDGVHKTFTLLTQNLNLLIHNNVPLDEKSLSNYHLLKTKKSLGHLFNVINRLEIKFQYFTSKTVGKDDWNSTNAYILPHSNIKSKYINSLIEKNISKTNRICKIDEIIFSNSHDELVNRFENKRIESAMYFQSEYVKNEDLEFCLKDALKLNLCQDFDPTLELISDITHSMF
jgi:hypothetical protein